MAGRPSLPPERRRNKILQILCTQPGRERLKNAARLAGFKSVSTWAWTVLHLEADRISPNP